jgi:hypothetical protein
MTSKSGGGKGVRKKKRVWETKGVTGRARGATGAGMWMKVAGVGGKKMERADVLLTWRAVRVRQRFIEP